MRCRSSSPPCSSLQACACSKREQAQATRPGTSAFVEGTIPYGLDLGDYQHLGAREYARYHPGMERLIARLDDIPFGPRIGSIEDAPFPDATFDRVFSYLAFAYVRDKLQGLKEIHRMLSPGGYAFVDFSGAQGDDLVRPSLEEISRSYPNAGQVRAERVTLHPLEGGTRTTTRVVIEKRADTPLSFPSLEDAYRDRRTLEAHAAYASEK